MYLPNTTHIQAGAFFIWIVYAIGARLVPDPENSTEVSTWWCKREKPSLNVIGIFCSRSPLPPGCHGFTGHGNSASSPLSSTVLLSSPNRNSNLVRHIICYLIFQPAHEWARHLVGLALRLCIKLRYHRKVASSPVATNLDPYTIELRKRFFWCAYCFDRFGLQTLLPLA